jgi:hypothetical protein
MTREMAVFSRYETATDRSLHRARHELERLQARRRGETVLAPIAVTVSGVIGTNDQAAAAVPESRRQDQKEPRQMTLEFGPGAGDVNIARCAPLPSQSVSPPPDGIVRNEPDCPAKPSAPARRNSEVSSIPVCSSPLAPGGSKPGCPSPPPREKDQS